MARQLAVGVLKDPGSGLDDAAADLRSALAAPGDPPTRWLHGVETTTGALSDALTSFARTVQRHDGLFDEVVGRAPRLAPRVGRLRDQHKRLIEQCERLWKACRAGTVEVVGEQAHDLLRAVGRHRSGSSQLVHDAFAIDLGGE